MLKSFPKILTIFFLTMFILQMIFLFFLLAAPVASQAAEISLASPVTEQAKNMQFTPQVTIPGYEFKPTDPGTGNIANLVRAIYNYGIGIVGILAAIVLMFGGVLWIVAGGNTTQVGEAKSWIGAALTGLLLALTSYLILDTVNPALVNLQTSGIQTVAESTTGSCTPTESPCIDNYTEGACKKIYGNFVKGGKCPTGSCTTEICQDNYEEKACIDNGGTFVLGAKCGDISCCSYSTNPNGSFQSTQNCEVGVTQNYCTVTKKGRYNSRGRCTSGGICTLVP